MIRFHLRPCLSKIVYNFLKYFTPVTLRAYITSKIFFCNKSKEIWWHAQTLYISLISAPRLFRWAVICHSTVCFPVRSGPPDPDPAKFCYLSSPWVTPKKHCSAALSWVWCTYRKSICYPTKLNNVVLSIMLTFQKMFCTF